MRQKSVPKWPLAAVLCCVFLLSGGCDPVSRHRTLSLIFDGVPDYPPVDLLCEDYHQQRLVEEAKPMLDASGAQVAKGSSRHLPYAEKRCQDCHDQQKPGGLITDKRKLCFVCHQDFVVGDYVHGPVSVGDCLACHVPHSSGNASLLVLPPEELCGKCHKESRLAANMHDKVTNHQLSCASCHDPHAGEAKYFLK